jgi:hypothetical protein
MHVALERPRLVVTATYALRAEPNGLAVESTTGRISAAIGGPMRDGIR